LQICVVINTCIYRHISTAGSHAEPIQKHNSVVELRHLSSEWIYLRLHEWFLNKEVSYH